MMLCNNMASGHEGERPTKGERGRLGAADLGQGWASETLKQGIDECEGSQACRHKTRGHGEQAV